jgi:predicted metal-dependent peptidase
MDEEGDAEQEGGRSAAEVQAIRANTARAIKEYATKNRGSVPAGWVRWADEQLDPPKVRWQDKLRRSVRGAVTYTAGMIEWSFDRPSKRQPIVGYSTRSPILPRTRAPLPSVMVVVDTSGSMGAQELKRAVSETNGIVRAVRAKVTFCECDAKVHTLRPISNVRCIELKGGGGTSFQPPFAELAKLRTKPSAVVFITDGQGDAPVDPPPGVRVIWLLVGPHRQRPHAGTYGAGPIAWGEFIEVDEDDVRAKETA